MEKFNAIRIALLLLTSVSCFTFAAEAIIYRWVDENNIVHFSQQQPEHDNYTMINAPHDIRNDRPVEKKPEQSFEDYFKKNNTDTADDSTIDPKDATLRCQEAQANIKVLTEYNNVQVKDKDGKARLLSDAEKKVQLNFNQEQAKLYCN